MKKWQKALITAMIFLPILGCGTTNPQPNEMSIIPHAKAEQAHQSVMLALEYHDQNGYEKSAELFIEAADLYRELDFKDEEKRSLIAAAKMLLKCGQRNQFLLTMAKYRGLIDAYNMPPEDERLLVNLADQMKGRPLTYPVAGMQHQIFNN